MGGPKAGRLMTDLSQSSTIAIRGRVRVLFHLELESIDSREQEQQTGAQEVEDEDGANVGGKSELSRGR